MTDSEMITTLRAGADKIREEGTPVAIATADWLDLEAQMYATMGALVDLMIEINVGTLGKPQGSIRVGTPADMKPGDDKQRFQGDASEAALAVAAAILAS